MAEAMGHGCVVGVEERQKARRRRGNTPAETVFGVLLLVTALLASYGALSFVVRWLAWRLGG